jgi:transcriptional regulator with XRE-family HTH domain
MVKTLTEADVLEAYRAAHGKNKSEFSAELGMSRQAYNNYLNGAKQDIQGLQESAIQYVGTWFGELCNDLLKARGAIVPCVCQTAIGDNGQCPKHGLVCDGGGKA